MGRRANRGGTTSGPRSIFTHTEREVRRIQLHNISLVCDTTVELLARAERGEQSTGHYDGGATAATNERASESTPIDSGTSTTTV